MEVITLEYMKDISLIYVNKKGILRINQKRNVVKTILKKIHVSRFIITNIAERVIATYTKLCEGFV